MSVKPVKFSKLVYRRSELIKKATLYEIQFMHRLTGGRIKFQFQHVIPPYIVDFFIPKRMLIIELDGSHHLKPEKKAYDDRRSEYLRSHGFVIIRIPNDQVKTWPLKKIRQYPKCKGARDAVDLVKAKFVQRMQRGKNYGSSRLSGR